MIGSQVIVSILVYGPPLFLDYQRSELLFHLIENGYGKVVNMSSILGAVGLPHQLAYASSKGGVDQMTKVMALEWAKLGVRVNAICPGLIKTDFAKALWDNPEAAQRANEQIPLRRLGNVNDIAAAVLFLLSEDAAYITGQVLGVDGGFHM